MQLFVVLGKGKVVLVLNSAPCHEDIWDSGGIVPPFLTLALYRGEWLASHPDHSIPGERGTSTYRVGGWVDPRISLDAVQKRKILPLLRIEPWPSSP
jgi:hypothetical protein